MLYNQNIDSLAVGNGTFFSDLDLISNLAPSPTAEGFFMEKETNKKCGHCNTIIYNSRPNKIYCSSRCRRNSKFQRRKAGGKGDLYTQVILSYFDNKCTICEEDKNLIIHHIVPLSKGGKNHILNVTCLCKKCHLNLHMGIFSKSLNKFLQTGSYI